MHINYIYICIHTIYMYIIILMIIIVIIIIIVKNNKICIHSIFNVPTYKHENICIQACLLFLFISFLSHTHTIS